LKPTPGVVTGMDDALRRRLDRLTWLIGGLLVAVLAMGFQTGGSRYVVTVFAVFVLGVIVAVVGTVLSSLADLPAGEDA